MNVLDFQTMKNQGKKISMVTCYDYWSAQVMSHSDIDCILVGDSAAMVMHGHQTTIPATMEMMIAHTQAVNKGAPNKFIIGDLPFCSYRKSLSETMSAIDSLMKAGSHAIKLEGADDNAKTISHIVKSGVPVMGHIGLTPQSFHALGGFKVQGRGKQAADQLCEDALALQDAGCFAIVLECIPYQLAEHITQILTIPTIGIGAGPFTSGQVLVLQDLLGLNASKQLKLAKAYINGFEQVKQALNQYNQEVKESQFPRVQEHCFTQVEYS